MLMTWTSKQSFYRETTNTILPQCKKWGKNGSTLVSTCYYIQDSFILLPVTDICWSFRTCGYWREITWQTGHSTDKNWRTPPSTSPSGSSTLDRQCPSKLLAMPGGWQPTFQELCFLIWSHLLIMRVQRLQMNPRPELIWNVQPRALSLTHTAFASWYTEARATSATLVGLYIS